MKLETICVHGSSVETYSGAVSFPIFQSATFAHPGGVSTGYDYSRLQNPTRANLESVVAALEGGADALAFSSGMAAMSALMELFKPGDHIVASADLYGGSIRLFDNVSVKNGVSVDYADTSDLATTAALIRPNTAALFIETPTNPMMHVTDLAAAAKLAKAHNILLIVDNTFLTPYFCRPIELGADIVVHSGTKFLGGHNDTLAGFLVAATSEISERLRFVFKTTGACLSPFDSFLITRGIKTLALRMERSQSNALEIAKVLERHLKVKKIYYVGLETHPSYELSRRQAAGFGAMISFETDSEQTAKNVLTRLKLVLFAESLGGTETLITYPVTQTHADVPEQQRLERGINGRLLRLSVGVENAADIIQDLEQALL
ncbi:cystathionine gamma-synthase [Clostridia bacterium]|nr:cystathionine gamma-synthase [Clostridia bacterium]